MQDTSRNTLTYVRISDDKTGEELGVTRQQQDCLAVVKSRGWQLVGQYSDNDITAKGNRKRPGFEALLDEISTGKANIIVAWNLDRLTRNRRDTLRLMELCQEHGVTIALARGTDLDMSVPGGRLMAGLLAEIARNEIDVKADRQIRAYRQAAEAGKPHFVSRPYGYTRSAELIEDEALILKQMSQHYLNGWSLHEITAWLNASGFPSTTGKVWHRRVVKDQLVAKRNAGIRVYKGEEFQGTWTPIFDMDTHSRLVAEHKRRGENIQRGKRTARRYLLTGLLECGQCGHQMAGHKNRDGAGQPVRDKYQCFKDVNGDGCGSLSRNAMLVDHFVKEAVLYRLDSPALQKIILENEANAGQIEPLRNKEAALKARVEELLDDYTDNTITKPEYQRAKRRLICQLEAVEQDIAGLYSSQQAKALLSAGTKLRERYDAESNGWRRKLIGLIVEKIVIKRGHGRQGYFIAGKRFRFDPEAVEIVWKV